MNEVMPLSSPILMVSTVRRLRQLVPKVQILLIFPNLGRALNKLTYCKQKDLLIIIQFSCRSSNKRAKLGRFFFLDKDLSHFLKDRRPEVNFGFNLLAVLQEIVIHLLLVSMFSNFSCRR